MKFLSIFVMSLFIFTNTAHSQQVMLVPQPGFCGKTEEMIQVFNDEGDTMILSSSIKAGGIAKSLIVWLGKDKTKVRVATVRTDTPEMLCVVAFGTEDTVLNFPKD